MLPDLPSDLIRVALVDLRRCEADPRYKVCMYEWHIPGRDETGRSDYCYVCLAGSVMAKSLGADKETYALPNNYVESGEDVKLRAVNDFRSGYISVALAVMGLVNSIDNPVPNREIVEYSQDTIERFHTEMQVLAQELEEVGL